MGGPDGRIKWRIIGTKIIFKIKANVSHYDSWEQESLLRGFVTVCCACHLCCPPGITFCYSVNQDRGGPERRRKRNNNKLNRV